MTISVLHQEPFLIECFETRCFYVALAMQASPEHPEENQDAAFVREDAAGNLLAAVADGFGGAPCGAEAAKLSLDALRTATEGADSLSADVQTIASFDRANEAVRALRCGAASTLVSAWFGADGTVRIAHAGDSLGLIFGRSGKLKYRALEHSPSAYALEAGISKQAVSSELADDMQLVLNFVGSPMMTVEVGSKREMSVYDTVLLASDGLSDNLSAEAIAELARSGSVEQSAADLLSAAMDKIKSGAADSKPDDVSLILCRRRLGEG